MSFGPSVDCYGVMTGSVFLWCIPRYCSTVQIFVNALSYDWTFVKNGSVKLLLNLLQVVTIATYSFFLAALVGRQYVEERSKSYQMEVDIYVPVFTILQFFFYMGLLKVSYLHIKTSKCLMFLYVIPHNWQCGLVLTKHSVCCKCKPKVMVQMNSQKWFRSTHIAWQESLFHF